MAAAPSSVPARPALDMQFESEKNEKERKLYPIRDRPFQPNLSVKPLTGKFYARHDCVDVAGEAAADVDKIEEAIKRRMAYRPKDRTPEPETENMVYGWYLEPLVFFDRADPRFYHPKTSSWITTVGAIIDRETKKSHQKPFTGIPFKF